MLSFKSPPRAPQALFVSSLRGLKPIIKVRVLLAPAEDIFLLRTFPAPLCAHNSAHSASPLPARMEKHIGRDRDRENQVRDFAVAHLKMQRGIGGRNSACVALLWGSAVAGMKGRLLLVFSFQYE